MCTPHFIIWIGKQVSVTNQASDIFFRPTGIAYIYRRDLYTKEYTHKKDIHIEEIYT